MNVVEQMRYRPNWLVYVLLPLLHFASIQLTFLCALSPENQVVIWLPNAVLLAALLHFRGQRGWLLAALAFTSDLLANLSLFPPLQATLLGLVNLTEVTLVYLLLRVFEVSPGLERMRDLRTFVIAGPLFGAMLSGFLGAAVIQSLGGVNASYPTLVLLWWFGDGLGLLIYTPLLLAFFQPAREVVRASRLDVAVTLLSVGLAVLIFSGQSERMGGVALSPTLLLPSVLFMAARFGLRWTSLAVAVTALATAWAQTTGHKPFGDASPYAMILQTQEFILTLSIVGMGFAILFSEQRALTRSLEDKVRERTQALEASNSKLAALSMTDGLTGISNRRRFDEVLAEEWKRARRSGEPLALAMLDVDMFKSFNDHYGHQAGDDCLRMVAQVLTANVNRASDKVARYGGEEFALIAPNTDEASALTIAKTVCEALHAQGLGHASSPFGVLTASVGVAVVRPAKGETWELLIRNADKALYQAKARGRHQAVLFTEPD